MLSCHERDFDRVGVLISFRIFEVDQSAVQMLAIPDPSGRDGHGRAMQGKECRPRYIYLPRVLTII
jgi:hypothetical protein